MSELVEKVSAEMYRQYKAHPEWDDAKDVVESFDHKALVRVVLAHFAGPDNINADMLSVLNREQVLGNGPRRVLSAVFNAALKELEDKAWPRTSRNW